MSGLYNSMISENPIKEDILNAVNIKESDIARFRDVDIPPYDKFRLIPLFTDAKFKDGEACKDKDTAIVLTRIGGGNRENYKEGWSKIKNHPNYICDYDSSYDKTYAFVEFKISDEDMGRLKSMNVKHTLDIERVIESYMGQFKMILGITGTKMSEDEIYNNCKKMAWELVNGSEE